MQLLNEIDRVTPRRTARWLVIAALSILVVFAVALFFVVRNWPFTEQAVVDDLHEKFSGTVQIKNFRRTFFPSPGCVAEGLILRRSTDPSDKPFLQIQKITIQGSYAALFTAQRFVSQVRLDGARLSMAADEVKSTFAAGTHSSQPVKVGVLISDDAEIELTRKGEDKEPLTLRIRHLNMAPINAGRPTSFRLVLLNAGLPGEIRAEGQFGPVKMENPQQTPISGSYKFLHANLGVFQGIAGILSSEGKFNGPLEQLVVDDAADIPDFEVTRSGHRMDLQAKFHAIVNGTDGDVSLSPVVTHFAQTSIVSDGSVAGSAGQHGKTVSLDMTIKDGRIQDLLRLVVKTDRAPMNGAVSFRGKVTVPPEKQPFLEKLQVVGDFGIGGGQFTNASTQSSVNTLSARAEGDKVEPENVVSDVKGHLALNHGVAVISHLSFGVPGALVEMHGTYNLINQVIDLHGTLHMDVKLSQTTKGIKSFLLKAIDPLFKKKNGTGSVIAVKVTGTYSNPVYGLDVL